LIQGTTSAVLAATTISVAAGVIVTAITLTASHALRIHECKLFGDDSGLDHEFVFHVISLLGSNFTSRSDLLDEAREQIFGKCAVLHLLPKETTRKSIRLNRAPARTDVSRKTPFTFRNLIRVTMLKHID
jgi:hypothetical protein